MGVGVGGGGCGGWGGCSGGGGGGWGMGPRVLKKGDEGIQVNFSQWERGGMV